MLQIGPAGGHKSGHGRNPALTEQTKRDFERVRDEVLRTIPPVEFCGGAGSVALWHARNFHSSSRNFDSGTIRYVVHCDVCKKERAPPSADPWADWGAELQRVQQAAPSSAPR